MYLTSNPEKIKVLARLLRDKQVTVEEFVLLLQNEQDGYWMHYLQTTGYAFQTQPHIPYTVTSSSGILNGSNSLTNINLIP